MKPELTPEERAEFWRKRHDHLLASFTAEKARFEFEAMMNRLNARGSESGYQLAAGADGEPVFMPKPGGHLMEVKKEAS